MCQPKLPRTTPGTSDASVVIRLSKSLSHTVITFHYGQGHQSPTPIERHSDTSPISVTRCKAPTYSDYIQIVPSVQSVPRTFTHWTSTEYIWGFTQEWGFLRTRRDINRIHLRFYSSYSRNRDKLYSITPRQVSISKSLTTKCVRHGSKFWL